LKRKKKKGGEKDTEEVWKEEIEKEPINKEA
jgi:hypothetical protein